MSTHGLLFRTFLLSLALSLSACATTGEPDQQDPFESYNRAAHEFNYQVDRFVLKPVAQGYDTVVPEPISWGISNFFSNLDDITVVINDLLQGKFQQAAHDAGRFALNTTVGVGGIFDVAGHAGYNKNNEDFGQTLGVWGVDSGPYLVLPFLGPSTVRDTAALPVDMYTDPVMHVEGDDARIALVATRVVDQRASLLGAERVIAEATSDDNYLYIRDAFLQRRENLVYDGNPPLDDDFDVFED